MARVIKSMGNKMVLSGEGADEVFGGYLYFLQSAFGEGLSMKRPSANSRSFTCTTV
jgi:asparagine synthetase B (glutamine-hydrolysing)